MTGAILDVYGRPTKREVRQQVKHVALFLPVDPTTAVEKNQCRSWGGPVLSEVEIEFELDVVCLGVSDVGEDVVIDGGVIDPAIGSSLARCWNAKQNQQSYTTKQDHGRLLGVRCLGTALVCC